MKDGTYAIRIANRDPTDTVRATLKIIITEKTGNRGRSSGGQRIPKDFNEIARVKPKVSGLKESSFILGSKKVMETFKVTSLTPFTPKNTKVYQAEFKTGTNTDDSFMPSLPFEVKEQNNIIYAQIYEYSGRSDLFLTIYADGSEFKGD